MNCPEQGVKKGGKPSDIMNNYESYPSSPSRRRSIQADQASCRSKTQRCLSPHDPFSGPQNLRTQETSPSNKSLRNDPERDAGHQRTHKTNRKMSPQASKPSSWPKPAAPGEAPVLEESPQNSRPHPRPLAEQSADEVAGISAKSSAPVKPSSRPPAHAQPPSHARSETALRRHTPGE